MIAPQSVTRTSELGCWRIWLAHNSYNFLSKTNEGLCTKGFCFNQKSPIITWNAYGITAIWATIKNRRKHFRYVWFFSFYFIHTSMKDVAMSLKYRFVPNSQGDSLGTHLIDSIYKEKFMYTAESIYLFIFLNQLVCLIIFFIQPIHFSIRTG